MLAYRNEKDFIKVAKPRVCSQKLHGKNASYALKDVFQIKTFCNILKGQQLCTHDVFDGNFLTCEMLNDFSFHVYIPRNNFWKRKLFLVCLLTLILQQLTTYQVISNNHDCDHSYIYPHLLRSCTEH